MVDDPIAVFSRFADMVGGIVRTIQQKVLEPIGSFAGGIWDKVTEILGGLKSGIGSFVDTAKTKVTDIASSVGSGLETAIGWIVDRLRDVWTGIVDKINNIADGFREVFRNVTDKFKDFIRPITDRFGELVDTIRAKFTDVVSGLRDTVSNISSAISDGIGNVVGPLIERLRTSLGEKFSAIGEGINSFAITIKNALGAAFDNIGRKFREIADNLGDAIERMGNNLLEGFRDFTDRLGQGLADLRDSIASGIATFSTRIREAVQEFVALVAELPEALEFAFGSALQFVFGFNATDLGTELDNQLSGMLDELETNPYLPDSIKNLSIPHRSPIAPVLAFIGGIALAASLGTILTTLAAPHLERATQEISKTAQQAIPPVQTMIEGWRRGLLSDAELAELTLRSGFPPELTTFLQRVDKQILRLDEIQRLNLRGMLDDSDADSRLLQLGFQDADLELIRSLFFIRPPVQDVIRMAVREVFTPEIAERFGQFEDFPPEFVASAHQVGLRESDALNYWAAHWDLPSIGQAFEMLHRRVIDSEELSILLRAQDVMPYWRQRLTAISYRPLTRVDVRRMHLEGVITEEEVFNAYLDFGYNADNARRMTDFTVAWNARREESDEKALKDSTKAEITKLYRLRRITSADATAMLIGIGLKPVAAELTVSLIDFQREDALVDQKIKTIQRQFTGAQITEQDALVMLDVLNLSNDEAQTRVALWREMRKEEHAPIPSKADFMDAFDKEILPKDEFLNAMIIRLGYSEPDAELLGRIAVGEAYDER